MKNKTYPLFNILLYKLFGHAMLFGNGNYEDNIGVAAADELYEYDFKLNDRIPKEIKKELRYVDSINAYYYTSVDSPKIFHAVYFYMNWGRIRKISLRSVIRIEDNFTWEDYKPAYVMKILKDAYGESETAYTISRFVDGFEGNDSAIYNQVICKWKINNVIIEYYYIPYNDYTKLKQLALGKGEITFGLRYSMVKDE
jgi:hypothetical protein